MKHFVILFLFSLINYSNCCTGCVGLDELTFRKVVTKFKVVLVKFDQAFPFGDAHDAFTELASSEINNSTKSDSDNSEILIATVGVKDYGDFENRALGEKYGLSKRQESPVIKLFIDSDLDNPVDFEIGTEKVTSARLFSFLKVNSKIYIQAPGCVKELDDLAKEFTENSDKRKTILIEAETFIENIESEEIKNLAKTYTALMKGIVEKGEGFVAMQRDRMTKLLKDKLTPKKIEELNKKINIVASFRFEPQEVKEEL